MEETKELEQEEELKDFKIDNVLMQTKYGEPHKFITTMSAGQLASLYDNDIIIYNGELQRGTKTTAKGNIVDMCSSKHINEICEALATDNIHGGLITLNYNKDENEEELEYDEENYTLMGKGKLQVLDGAHRIKSSLKQLKKYEKDNDSVLNPNEYSFVVVIENLDNEGAASLFSEYATTPKPISKVRGSYLNVKDTSTQIVRYLMKNSDLKDRIEIVTSGIKAISDKIVKFSTLTKSVRTYFKPQTKKEREKIEKYLTSFFDEFVDLFSNKLTEENLNETRQKTLLLNDMFVTSYIAISKELENDDNWREKIKRLNDIIKIGEYEGELLSKENPLWQPILHDGYKIINKTSTQKYVIDTLISYATKDIPEIKKIELIS